MSKLRVLVVDDEPLVRQGLRASLAAIPDVELIGECRDGEEALTAIQTQRPDLVFLDVQMPGRTGLEVAQLLEPSARPAIVFVTAFDQYALQAFDLHAVDYLLKPFDDDRFRTALARARERLQGAGRQGFEQRLTALLDNLDQRRRFPDQLPVKEEGRIVFVQVGEITWIEAADNYVRLHTPRAAFLLRETLRRLEEELDPARFVRVHRSAMVRLGCVREIQPMFNGDYVIFLQDGTKVPLGRTYRGEFERRVGRQLFEKRT